MHVFVYGTLKQGHGNNGLLAGQTFVAKGTTTEEFIMFSNGGFPVVANADHLPDWDLSFRRVRGEVYELTGHALETLHSLDRLEGFPRMYGRQHVTVELEDTGIFQECLMYYGQPDFWRNFMGMPLARINEQGQWEW